MFESYHQAYEDLLSLTNLQVKPFSDTLAEMRQSLERTEAFLDMLGAPQEKMKFIHVGGTSGKGSVCNYLHNILLKDGKKVATYTSPHTTSFIERFQANNKLIAPAKLAEYMRDVHRTYEQFLAKNKGTLSFFELSIALAIYAFERSGIEWCVLEVGMGGRYDATNVISTPAVAVITNIDKDHTEFLGNSLTSIAKEKAGIIKRGGTVICGEARPKLKEIFKKEAIKQNAALFFINTTDETPVGIDLGRHQQQNAMLSIRAAQEIGIDEKTIAAALRTTKQLPCRFEMVQKSPMIVLDGAHSPAKMETTAERIKDMFGNAHVVFGCTASKDAKKMLDIIEPVAKSITITRFTTTFRKAANPAELFEHVPEKKRTGYFLDPRAALATARAKASKKDAIVVTGSLYMAGELREEWVSEEEILKTQGS